MTDFVSHGKGIGTTQGDPDQNAASLPERPPAVLCPWCGRIVDTYVPTDKPNLDAVMFGHRVESPHTLRTPWCKGGGRRA